MINYSKLSFNKPLIKHSRRMFGRDTNNLERTYPLSFEDANIELFEDYERKRPHISEKTILTGEGTWNNSTNINDLNPKDFFYNFRGSIKRKYANPEKQSEINLITGINYSLLHRNSAANFYVLSKYFLGFKKERLVIVNWNEIRIILKEKNLFSSNNGRPNWVEIKNFLDQSKEFRDKLLMDRTIWDDFCHRSDRSVPFSQVYNANLEGRLFDHQIELGPKLFSFSHSLKPNNKANEKIGLFSRTFLMGLLTHIRNLEEEENIQSERLSFYKNLLKNKVRTSPAINQFVNEANTRYRSYWDFLDVQELMWIDGDADNYPMFRVKIRDTFFSVEDKERGIIRTF